MFLISSGTHKCNIYLKLAWLSTELSKGKRDRYLSSTSSSMHHSHKTLKNASRDMTYMHVEIRENFKKLQLKVEEYVSLKNVDSIRN